MPTEETTFHQAPELRVPRWIDGNGQALDQALKLEDLGSDWKMLFAFQHWCPGCHSAGFPTLKILYDALHDKGMGFAVIQTVFEGEDQNTFDKLALNQKKYGLPIPFGHDTAPAGARLPSLMADYGTGGTPWFILIDPSGEMLYSDFRLNPQRILAVLGDSANDAGSSEPERNT